MSHSKTPHELLHIKLSGAHPTPENLAYLKHDDPEVVKGALNLMLDVPKEHLLDLIHSQHRTVATHAIQHPAVYEPHLHHGLEAQDPLIHGLVASHPKITHNVFKKILGGEFHEPIKHEAVGNPNCEPEWLKGVLDEAANSDDEAKQNLALYALFNPRCLENHKRDFILGSNNLKMQRLAAQSLMDHHVEVLNSEDVPLAVKKEVIKNKHFNKSDWWRVEDPHARLVAKQAAQEE